MTLSGLMVLSRLGSDVSGRLQSYSFFFFFVLGVVLPNVVAVRRLPSCRCRSLLCTLLALAEGA